MGGERRDVVVVGASAGGVEALRHLMSLLPADLPAAVLVVLHLPPTSRSHLPAILDRAGPLPARHAVDGEPLAHGTIRVAPPGRHLLVVDGHLRLGRGPRENGQRPAVDPLFRSAAVDQGPRVVGVVLSGALDDGSAGLLTIRRRGGVALVQDPADAVFAGMPIAAIDLVDPDHVASLDRLAALVDQVVRTPVADGDGTDHLTEDDLSALDLERRVAALDLGAIEAPRAGRPSPFACPDCHGVLWEVEEGDLTRFRCRTGHAWSPHALLAEQDLDVEESVWAGVRALEEQAALARRLAERSTAAGITRSAAHFEERAQAAQEHVRNLRIVLAERTPQPDPDLGEAGL